MSQKQIKRNKEQARTSVNVAFTTHGWDDYQHWKANDADISATVDQLIGECMRTPFEGTGKPKRLTGDLAGYTSRRITQEHRLVYIFEGDVLTIVSCRYHY